MVVTYVRLISILITVLPNYHKLNLNCEEIIFLSARRLKSFKVDLIEWCTFFRVTFDCHDIALVTVGFSKSVFRFEK